MATIVVIAIGTSSNNRGRCQYFASPEEVPEGYKLADQPETDIDDIMRINGWSKKKALTMMNL